MARKMKKTVRKVSTPRPQAKTSSTVLFAQNNRDIKQALKGKVGPDLAFRMLSGSGRPPKAVSRGGRGGRGGGASGVSWATAGPRKVVIRTIRGRKVPLGGNK